MWILAGRTGAREATDTSWGNLVRPFSIWWKRAVSTRKGIRFTYQNKSDRTHHIHGVKSECIGGEKSGWFGKTRKVWAVQFNILKGKGAAISKDEEEGGRKWKGPFWVINAEGSHWDGWELTGAITSDDKYKFNSINPHSHSYSQSQTYLITSSNKYDNRPRGQHQMIYLWHCTLAPHVKHSSVYLRIQDAEAALDLHKQFLQLNWPLIWYFCRFQGQEWFGCCAAALLRLDYDGIGS